ncbi:MAG: hypothetical protein KAS49_03840, partial [Candidatus Cloacimonetes bacterium]|nr:hypothetical protein [Candidatus Cloacimonadota bacterium]
GEVKKNEMALKRGYFRLEPKFSNNIKGRFNLDFFSYDVNDGVGVKLKYAYLDFSNILPIKDSKITVGLMKTYFGTIYDWDYTTIEKDPSDKYKFVSSTDYGVGISGYLPNGYGSYAIASYNGEGYKKTSGDINKSMNFTANLRVFPIPGVTVGGSYMMNSNNDKDELDNKGNKVREDINMLAGVTKLAFGRFALLGQYLTKTVSYEADKDDKTTTALSLVPTFKVNNSFDIVTRYDMYDPDTDKEDDGYNTIMAGFNYHIMKDSKNKPKLFVQTNYQITQYENDDDAVSEIMVQLRWIFSETINKEK